MRCGKSAEQPINDECVLMISDEELDLRTRRQLKCMAAEWGIPTKAKKMKQLKKDLRQKWVLAGLVDEETVASWVKDKLIEEGK